jgi:hypothetical protein
MGTEADPNKFTDAEIMDLREFVETVLTLCDRDRDLAVEVEQLALTAAEILGILEPEEGDDE